MVSVLTQNDRVEYREVLADMHRDRKRVFVDRLGWDVPVVDGQFEIDQFDTHEAVYLVVHDEAARRHVASLRLLPSTRPHLLSSVFPHLCEKHVPIGEEIWEISRLCIAPEVKDNIPPRIELMLALAEFALLSGIKNYTLVTHMAYLAQLLAIGWDCEPLGLPVKDASGRIGALIINITPATLSFLKAKTGVDAPVLALPSRIAA